MGIVGRRGDVQARVAARKGTWHVTSDLNANGPITPNTAKALTTLLLLFCNTTEEIAAVRLFKA